MISMQSDIKIEDSNGYGKGGRIIKYVRPAYDCFNRSRKVSGFTGSEVWKKIETLIAKWYYPKIIRYKINGVIICSNSKENAVKEYWRVSEKEDVGKLVDVLIPEDSE